jgi:hypothetical protein
MIHHVAGVDENISTATTTRIAQKSIIVRWYCKYLKLSRTALMGHTSHMPHVYLSSKGNAFELLEALR